jgi:PBP1b-binding outer membrane lipoprotein LpoB
MSISALCLAVALLSGCSSKTKVSRIAAEETVDLSGYWNSTDSRLVSDTMITDALTRPWLVSFVRDRGKNPAVIVGAIKNLTDEHIATGTFVGDIERALVNSGNVRVVATKTEREGVREEVDLTLTDMQSNEKVWLGQQKIQKYIARKGYKP